MVYSLDCLDVHHIAAESAKFTSIHSALPRGMKKKVAISSLVKTRFVVKGR
jgi:hypothetical protein